jgi:colicin import membrane protein
VTQALRTQTHAHGRSTDSRILQLQAERDKLQGDARLLHGRIDLARSDAKKMLAAHDALKARLQCSTQAAAAAAAERDAAQAERDAAQAEKDAAQAAASAHLEQCGAAAEAAAAQLRDRVASERADTERLLAAHGAAMGEAEGVMGELREAAAAAEERAAAAEEEAAADTVAERLAADAAVEALQVSFNG